MHDVICPEVEMWISGLSDAMFNLSQSQSFTIKTNIYNYGCSRKKSKSLSEIRAASIFSLFRLYDIGFIILVVIVICECDYFAKKAILHHVDVWSGGQSRRNEPTNNFRTTDKLSGHVISSYNNECKLPID